MRLARFAWPEFGYQFGGAAAAPFAAYYGTGLGQIPLHLDPARAVVSGGVVTSIPNAGGAGAAFNATPSGSVTISGGRLVATSTSDYLSLANLADLVGTRFFIVARMTNDESTSVTFAGRSDGALANQRVNLRWQTNGMAYSIWDGAAFQTPVVSNTTDRLGAATRLIEVGIAGNIRFWIDGVLKDTDANPFSQFLINRLLGGHNPPFFTGQVADILSMITDGSAAMDARAVQIRQLLAAKHGLTVA